MKILANIFLALMGYATGAVVAGGIFAFIAVLGIVPRLAQRTKTEHRLRWYEDVIVVGGVFGALNMIFNYSFHSHIIITIIIALASGMFVGTLSVSLAEVLNVMPIFMRRARLTKGLQIFVFAYSTGKMIGALGYFFLPYFK